MTTHDAHFFGRSRGVSIALGVLVVVLAIVFRGPLSSWFGTSGPSPIGAAMPSASAQGAERMRASAPDDIDHYTCSMHPSVNQPGPGKCPICGMDLVPVTKEQQTEGVVMIDEGRRQLIGVRTSAVTEGSLRSSFHAVGHIAYDESAFTDVNLKVHGWITKLLVNETGQRVARGQTLFTMYSPELYNAEQDFLLASRGSAWAWAVQRTTRARRASPRSHMPHGSA